MLDRFTGYKRLLALAALNGGGASIIERTATGNPLTFLTDLARPLKSLLIPFTPQQEGTGDPSPSNIRSIIPWNGLKVLNGGKNMYSYDETKITQETTSDGKTRAVYHTGLKNGSYALSGSLKEGQTAVSYGVNEGILKDGIATVKNTFITTTDVVNRSLVVGADEEIILINTADSISDMQQKLIRYNLQIELGSTATTYESPHITETDIVFPSPVYGGTLDVVSGVLTVTHVCLEVKKRDFLQQGQGEMPYRQTPNNYIIQHKPKSGVNWSMARQTQKMECAVIANPYSETTFGNYIGVCLCDVTIPTTFRISMDVYDSMQNDDDSVSICYEIAEPFEIQLTPTQLTALIGNNTIWSDADGSMTAVYVLTEPFADDHPISGGLGSGLLGGGFGSGSGEPDEPGEPDQPDEPAEPDQPGEE